jgi:hypothetical protein
MRTRAHRPQLVGGVVVLALYWDSDTACDAEHRTRWKVWSVAQLLIIAGHMALRFAQWRAGEARVPVSPGVSTARNALEALGLIW